MQLSREGIQRMIEGAGGGSGSGGGIGANDLIGYATEVWVNKNFLSIEFFSKLFKAYNGNTEVTPNDTETTITNIKAMFGFWTEQYISALGQGSGGGGGGATALIDLVDVTINNPTDGQVLKYNATTHKWYNGTDEGLTSLPWSSITSKPTTLSGYGITDAYISSGTIYLGGNSITPLTSFTETDPTVPAWAKASTKPSYAFSEITGSVAFSQLPTIYWADVAVSNSSNNNTSPQFGNLRLRPGSDNYGSYLYFGDGNYAYLAELSDDHLTYEAGSHTFNVSSNEAVQINSSGLRIGGSSGVVLSWDSSNNALKIQKADGTAANFYATGGVSALGQGSGGGGGGASALTDLVDVAISNPTDGQVLKYNATTHKWYNGTDEGLTSLPWSSITSKPTTLSGYGITDAYISSGTIYLGGNSITPLTSFTETDPTVPAWAKASTKPSYAFSEITGSVAFSQLPTMYWADVAVSNSSNNNTSPQFGNLRLRPGSDNYGSYLYFGDGNYAYLAELSDDHLTYRAGSHTFNVSSNEAVQINSSGLRIGGSSGVVLSWDSTNNALKVQKADGTAANFYATGGVSALGLGGSGGSGSIGNLRVTGTLNIGSSYASLYCNSDNYLHVDAPRIYFDSTLYMGSNNIRTESGDIYTEEGNIYLGGGRLYLDNSRYIYLDGTTLKFYDGSTAKTIYTY